MNLEKKKTKILKLKIKIIIKKEMKFSLKKQTKRKKFKPVFIFLNNFYYFIYFLIIFFLNFNNFMKDIFVIKWNIDIFGSLRGGGRTLTQFVVLRRIV
jgi:hypothetical protein